MKVNNPANFDSKKEYSLAEAVSLLKQLSTSKFAGTVNVDAVIKRSKKNQNDGLKGSVSLPHTFGAAKRVIVFCDEALAAEAKKAGAVDAGLDELVKKVEAGSVQYDVVLATPDVMPKIARLGRVLGPRGLMPNPSNGTIGTNVADMIASYMGGKMTFKMSDQGVVRAGVAKVDMEDEAIVANLKAFLQSIISEGRKFGAQPFARITLSPTMGKGVKINLSELYSSLG